MLNVQGLVKDFGPIRAVDNISFQAQKGEVLGFLGPNGAGKSTTMKMITCFLPPSSGTAKVKGMDILENPIAVREALGYLPESAPLYEDMTVEAFLGFIAQVRGFSGKALQDAIARVYDLCQIKGVRFQSIGTLSKGFRQRVCFAQALIHDPEILILDEPTDGLDPNQKKTVRDMISQMKEHKLIILSTHILEEVEAICTRAIIISQGKLKIDATPQELRKKSEVHGAVTLTLDGNCDDEAIKKDLGERITNLKRVTRLPDGEGMPVRIRCYPNEGHNLTKEVVSFIESQKVPVVDLVTEQGRLDEVFRNITKSEA